MKICPGISSIRRYLRNKSADFKNTTKNSISLNNEPLRIAVALEDNLKRDLNTIIEFCNEIHDELGPKHREVVYHRAIEKELRLHSIPYKREAEADIDYKGDLIGKDRIDFLISSGVLIEIKAKLDLDCADYNQAKRYLRSFDGKVCILVNFGSRTIQIKKFSKRTTMHS